MIFERFLRTTEHNLISAVYRCTLNKSLPPDSQAPPSNTIQDACMHIQNNDNLVDLKHALSTSLTSFYRCHTCSNDSVYRSTKNDQIFIFKTDVNGKYLAYEVISDVDDEVNNTKQCACRESDENVSIQIHSQLFTDPPHCLIVSTSNDSFFESLRIF